MVHGVSMPLLCLDWFHCCLLKLPLRGLVPAGDTTSPSCGFSLSMLEPGNSPVRSCAVYHTMCSIIPTLYPLGVHSHAPNPSTPSCDNQKMFLVGQNHPWLRTTVLKGRGTLGVNLCVGVPFLPPLPQPYISKLLEDRNEGFSFILRAFFPSTACNI